MASSSIGFADRLRATVQHRMPAAWPVRLLLTPVALAIAGRAVWPAWPAWPAADVELFAWPSALLLAAVWHAGLAVALESLVLTFLLQWALLGDSRLAAAMALLQTAAAVGAGTALRRSEMHGGLGRLTDVLIFCAVGALGAALGAALLAGLWLVAEGQAALVSALVSSFALATALSVLGLTPALLVWFVPVRDLASAVVHSPFEQSLFVVALIVTAIGHVSSWHPEAGQGGSLTTLLFLPVLLWAATRFGQRGTTACVFFLLVGQGLAAEWLHWQDSPVLRVATLDDVLGWQLALSSGFVAILLLGGTVEERRSAVALRDEFLLVASHELKTPLTALMLGIENMGRCMRRHPEAPAATHLSKVATCQAQIVRMARLVEGLLEVSQFNNASLRLTLKPHEFGEIVRSAATGIAARAKEQRCELACQVPQAVWGLCDSARLRQLLGVLLDNACKYGAGRPIEMSLIGDARFVHIVVADHGIGIRTADLRRIFFQFERAVSARSYGGLGLGLFLARKIAIAHGGELWAEQGTSDGARFVLRLPRQPVHQAEGRVVPV